MPVRSVGLTMRAVDPVGRFLVGTLSLDGPSQREALVRLEADGTLSELDGDLTLPNGLPWSIDGRLMYSVDILRRTQWLRAWSARRRTDASHAYRDVSGWKNDTRESLAAEGSSVCRHSVRRGRAS